MIKLIPLQLLKNVGGYNAGEIAGFSKRVATEMIRKKQASLYYANKEPDIDKMVKRPKRSKGK